MAELVLEVDEKSFKKFKKDLLTTIAMEIFSKSQQNLVEPDEKGRIITDTGALLRSGNVETWTDKAKIVYDAPYADFVEFGTDPHWVPIDVLVKWCKRKLRMSDREAREVARRIQLKIAKKGTDPRRFLRNAIDEVRAKYR